MSKSLGNGIDPLEIIDKYGADALRFSLLQGVVTGNDIRYSDAKVQSAAGFINKIWNASRYVLTNCEGRTIKSIHDVKLGHADKWIISRLQATIRDVTLALNKLELGIACQTAYDFMWYDFCDWYIEFSKTALYSDDDEKRSNAASVLVYVLRETLKLAHPIVPFITEEIYDALPNKDAEDIMISPFPEANPKHAYRADSAQTDAVIELIKSVRNLRREMNVSQNKRTAVYIVPKEGKEKQLKKMAGYIEKLAFASGVYFGEPSGKNASLVTTLGNVFIPMGDLVDFDKERARLKAEIEKTDEEIARARGKLENKGFTEKAPAALVEKEKEKLVKYEELKKGLVKSLEALD